MRRANNPGWQQQQLVPPGTFSTRASRSRSLKVVVVVLVLVVVLVVVVTFCKNLKNYGTVLVNIDGAYLYYSTST